MSWLLAAASSLAALTLAARMEERLLSLRFISPWRSRMASSMELVKASCSAVASSWATLFMGTLLAAVPGRLWTTDDALDRGFGCAILVPARTERVCKGGVSPAAVDGDISLSPACEALEAAVSRRRSVVSSWECRGKSAGKMSVDCEWLAFARVWPAGGELDGCVESGVRVCGMLMPWPFADGSMKRPRGVQTRLAMGV